MTRTICTVPNRVGSKPEHHVITWLLCRLILLTYQLPILLATGNLFTLSLKPWLIIYLFNKNKIVLADKSDVSRFSDLLKLFWLHVLRCQHPSENWLCLSCKDVLCSRFVNKHMLQHFHQTNHCLALSYRYGMRCEYCILWRLLLVCLIISNRLYAFLGLEFEFGLLLTTVIYRFGVLLATRI